MPWRIGVGTPVSSSRRRQLKPRLKHWVHVGKFDSRGNFYTGEVDTGKRLQKWVPSE
jgi:hypothetical protein